METFFAWDSDQKTDEGLTCSDGLAAQIDFSTTDDIDCNYFPPRVYPSVIVYNEILGRRIQNATFK